MHKFLLEHSLVSLPHLLSPPSPPTPTPTPSARTTRRKSKLAASTDNNNDNNDNNNNQFDPVEDMTFFLKNDCILSPLPSSASSSSASFSSSLSFVNDLKVVRETADCLGFYFFFFFFFSFFSSSIFFYFSCNFWINFCIIGTQN